MQMVTHEGTTFSMFLSKQQNICVHDNVTLCFSVYEGGACFSPDVLDITTEDIMSRFVEVCQTW